MCSLNFGDNNKKTPVSSIEAKIVKMRTHFILLKNIGKCAHTHTNTPNSGSNKIANDENYKLLMDFVVSESKCELILVCAMFARICFER